MHTPEPHLPVLLNQAARITHLPGSCAFLCVYTVCLAEERYCLLEMHLCGWLALSSQHEGSVLCLSPAGSGRYGGRVALGEVIDIFHLLVWNYRCLQYCEKQDVFLEALL